MFFTTELLLASAKRSEFFPLSQTTFTDPDDLIAYANEEMMTKLVPFVVSAREDYFLTTSQTNIQANLDSYNLPERAIGNTLKDLMYAPDAAAPLFKYPLVKTNLHDSQTTGTSAVVPIQFYMRDSQVTLIPRPASSQGALVFLYSRRPSQLVETSSVAKITSIATVSGTTTFTVDTDLTASLSVGSLVDFLAGKSPFSLWAQDVVITAITATTIAVTATDVEDSALNVEPVAGDYICPAQTANIPMIPQEFHPILAEMICFRALKALGHTQQMQVVSANIASMIQGAFKLISNRVEQEVDVVYDRNSILNSIGTPSFGISKY